MESCETHTAHPPSTPHNHIANRPARAAMRPVGSSPYPRRTPRSLSTALPQSSFRHSYARTILLTPIPKPLDTPSNRRSRPRVEGLDPSATSFPHSLQENSDGSAGLRNSPIIAKDEEGESDGAGEDLVCCSWAWGLRMLREIEIENGCVG